MPSRLMNRYYGVPPLNQLKAFEAAARLGSFKLASEELHLSPSAITQSISQLESRITRKLFSRSNQKVALTDFGREYYQSVLVGLESLVSLPGPVQKKQLQRITLSAPPFLVQQHLLPQIHQLEKLFPNLDLNIIAEHKVADLMNGDVDLAIRFGLGEWEGITAYPLMPLIISPICSKEYAKQHKLVSLDQLSELNLLHLSTATRGWHWWLSQHQIAYPSTARSLEFNDYNGLIQACINHAGIALGLRPSIDNLLEQSCLILPFSQKSRMQEQYYFVFPTYRRQDPIFDKLFQWIKYQLPLVN